MARYSYNRTQTKMWKIGISLLNLSHTNTLLKLVQLGSGDYFIIVVEYCIYTHTQLYCVLLLYSMMYMCWMVLLCTSHLLYNTLYTDRPSSTVYTCILLVTHACKALLCTYALQHCAHINAQLRCVLVLYNSAYTDSPSFIVYTGHTILCTHLIQM